MRSPVYKLFVFTALFIAGTLMAGLLLGVVALARGYGLSEFIEMMGEGVEGLPLDIVRASVWVQTLAAFIVPAIIFGLIFYYRDFFSYFELTRWPALSVLGLSAVVLIAGYPLVQLSYEVNQLLPVSEWMRDMEQNAADILGDVLNMNSAGDFVLTLVMVAILPAIGEELVFRGIFQKQFTEWTKSPLLSIWLAAFVFSAIHFQFEGFLPRLILGAILGHLYYWTRTLWVPIIIHFINNGVQVGVLYFSGVDLSQMDEQASEKIEWWVVLLSTALLYAASHQLIKMTKKGDE
jgi:CAAX protease family protein